MLIKINCKKHLGCLYDVLCTCDNCDNYTNVIFFNIWRRFAYLLAKKYIH